MPDRTSSIGFYVSIVIVALFVLGGFYFLFDKMNSLETRIGNLELAAQLAAAKPAATVPVPATVTSTPVAPEAPATPAAPAVPTIAIPTAILLDAQSSAAMPPQVGLTISVDSVTKAADGTLAVNVKVYTGNATGPSAVNLQPLFQLIDLNGVNTLPTKVVGAFDSMPAKSASSGSVVFTTDPTKTDFIIQVGPPESAKYYEFDFSKLNYKETVVG